MSCVTVRDIKSFKVRAVQTFPLISIVVGCPTGCVASGLCDPTMTLGRLIYKSILQITNQYEVKRLPLTGVVGVTEARFRYPPIQLFRDAFQARGHNPDFDGARNGRAVLAKLAIAAHVRRSYGTCATVYSMSCLQRGVEPSSSCKLSMLC